MLSCKDVSKLTSEYLDNNLPFFLRMKFKLHLFVCHNCRKFVEQMHMTISVLNKLPVKQADEKIVEQQAQLLAQLNKQVKAEQTSPDNHK